VKKGEEMNRKTVSGIMVTLLLVGTLLLAFSIQPVRAVGTIYIRPDGSIDPPTAPIHRDGDLYTLTDNITCDADGIVIERNNMTLDGGGYWVQGPASYGVFGIDLSHTRNVTIKNTNIKGFRSGIYSYSSVRNTITRNVLINNMEFQGAGITLKKCEENIVVENDIIENYYGIIVAYVGENILYHNNLINNVLQAFSHDNSVNVWDDGYPSGGNYWSDYEETYPDAEELDDSGIWDTPYYIDDINQDNYPLMEPWTPIPPVEDTEAYIEYVNETIQDLQDGIFSRPDEDVPDAKNDFSDLFDDALENIDEGNYEGAIEKLNTIKMRMYEEIVESDERQEIISLIEDFIEYLETLL